jgi:hypothetical protein
VIYDAPNKTVKPVADIVFETKPAKGLNIIPVVFIRNKALENSSFDACTELGEKICRRIKLLADSNYPEKINEIQIDCDWSAETKTKFFALLSACKKSLPGTALSCTVRLHQVKYFKACGVPPVDRGMLMFYNMGNLSSLNNINSIYDYSTAQKYLVNFENYPLPLDVAVPLFDMAVLYHGNKPVNTVSPEITGDGIFRQVNANLFFARRDTFLELTFIHAGDMVKVEKAGLEQCLAASKQIAPYLQSNQFTVSIFDLKPATFFKYDTSGISQIYNSFR